MKIAITNCWFLKPLLLAVFVAGCLCLLGSRNIKTCDDAKRTFNVSDTLVQEVPYQEGDSLVLVSTLNDTVVLVATGLKKYRVDLSSGQHDDCDKPIVHDMEVYYSDFIPSKQSFQDFAVEIKYFPEEFESVPFLIISTFSGVLTVDKLLTSEIPPESQYKDSVNVQGKFVKGYFLKKGAAFYNRSLGIVQMNYQGKIWTRIN